MAGPVIIDRRGTRLDDIVLTEYVDPLWRGRAADGREVLVAIRAMKYTQERDELFRYEVPGLARAGRLRRPGRARPLVLAVVAERRRLRRKVALGDGRFDRTGCLEPPAGGGLAVWPHQEAFLLARLHPLA
jgi:hypothetical protein